METSHNLNYREGSNQDWLQVNISTKRYLTRLLFKEVLKMLPSMLLFKIRQFVKWIIALAMFALILFLAPKNSYAQTDSTTHFKKLALENKYYPKNNVQINLSSLAFKNYNFSYERSLSRKITFVAGYRYMPLSMVSDIPLVKKAIDKYANDDSDLKDNLSNLSTGNKTYTGEFRFYGGKHPGARGFYLSLYGRYTNMQANYNYNYTGSVQKYNIPLKNTLKGFGGGLMIGSKYLIAKRVTLDWYIIGGHYGKLKGDGIGSANLSTMTAADKQNVKADIEDTFTIADKSYVNATVDNSGVKTQVNAPFVGIRGLGFNLGIAF